MPEKYSHHMIKEIYEEPNIVKKTIDEEKDNAKNIAQEIKSKGYEMIYITGSGTSYHAGLASQYALSNLTNIATSIIPASEFQRWVPVKISRKVLLMAISQSGESSDVIQAARAALDRKMALLAVTNTLGSKLAEMSDYHLLSRSGHEEAVPATKTYVAQLISIFMLSVELAIGTINPQELIQIRNGLYTTPQLIQKMLRSLNTQIEGMAEQYRDKNFMFLLGSGPDYATALEGALKLKETCTIFAEGFATREFLHGPMRLIDERTLVTMMVSQDEIDTYMELGNSFHGFGAPIIAISEDTINHAELRKFSNYIIPVPRGLPKVFSPLLNVVPLQLFAYYSSLFRGLNPDKPEKITKVVK